MIWPTRILEGKTADGKRITRYTAYFFYEYNNSPSWEELPIKETPLPKEAIEAAGFNPGRGLVFTATLTRRWGKYPKGSYLVSDLTNPDYFVVVEP